MIRIAVITQVNKCCGVQDHGDVINLNRMEGTQIATGLTGRLHK